MRQLVNKAIDFLFGGSGARAAFVFAAMVFASARLASASVEDGDRAMNAGRYRVAIAQYEAHLKENPGDSDVMIKAAQAYEGAQWWGQAVQWWEKYLAISPAGAQADNAKIHAADCRRWIGSNYYITGGSYKTAVGELNKAIDLNPALADAYVWLATIYQNEGMFDETVAILDKGLAAAPDDEILQRMRKDAKNYRDNGGRAYAAHRKGITLYEGGDITGALALFREASAASDDFAAAHLWIARILFEQGHFAESIPEWQTSIRIRPDNESALFYLKLAQRNVAEGK